MVLALLFNRVHTFEFLCSPDISVSWKKPDGSTPGGTRYNFLTTSQMQITDVQKSDEGTYTCTGTSPSSGLPSATATINVIVQCKSIAQWPQMLGINACSSMLCDDHKVNFDSTVWLIRTLFSIFCTPRCKKVIHLKIL